MWNVQWLALKVCIFLFYFFIMQVKNGTPFTCAKHKIPWTNHITYTYIISNWVCSVLSETYFFITLVLYVSRQFRNEMSGEWCWKVNAVSYLKKNIPPTINLTNSVSKSKRKMITHFLKHFTSVWPLLLSVVTRVSEDSNPHCSVLLFHVCYRASSLHQNIRKAIHIELVQWCKCQLYLFTNHGQGKIVLRS